MQRINSKTLAHTVLLPILAAAKCVVDATAGNGHDTVFLAEHSTSDCSVYAFDIQQDALDATKRLAEERGTAEKVRLIHDSHANVDAYIDGKIDAAMFNLGYLPSGDHTVTTEADSTIEAIRTIARKLSVGGMITVVSYSGHESGAHEQERLLAELSAFPVSCYTVSTFRMINHKETAPMLFLIEKVRCELP
ncbi:MAG: class I SAM-dependent methyltransferase [Selenomonadales bacterium]|nr:class I SAM-dependent methyltransferase [Selenomonadales bacterium]